MNNITTFLIQLKRIGKTIGKDDLAGRFVNNANIPLHELDREDDFREMLIAAFVWGDSREGHEFWECVNHHLRHAKNGLSLIMED